MEVVVEPCEVIVGEVDVPGDKSLSHRSVMLAALADTPTHISGFLPGLDALASLKVIQTLGVETQTISPTELVIKGQGKAHFLSLLDNQDYTFDFQNAGTGIRLFSGLLARTKRRITLIGDSSLSRRPMKRITQPLREMGIDIAGARSEHSEEETAPLSFNASGSAKKNKVTPLNYVLPKPSAQVKSCLLLAGLFVPGKTKITEPIQTRDHTERMLQEFGVPLKKLGRDIIIDNDLNTPKLGLKNGQYDIVKDFSSAAFFIVAALIAKQANIVIKNIGLNPTRTGLLTVLSQMGADIQIFNLTEQHKELVGDLHITHKNKLKGTHISPQMLALMIDEFPIFLLAALSALEPTVIEGIEELAYKESNRIEAMIQALNQIGAKFDWDKTNNKLVVYPLEKSLAKNQPNLELNLASAKDHRVAMTLFMASLLVKRQIKVRDLENIQTSFPTFFEEAKKVGFCFKIITNQGGAECLQ